MASFEQIGINRDTQHTLIDEFRNFYSRVNNSDEVPGETLVSHHDSTIRFTNSTTSVMKPYLIGERDLDHVPYMAQSAMGQQGLFYWQRDNVFGPYASYFASLGALYGPDSQGIQPASDMQAISEAWGIPSSHLEFSLHETDTDLVPSLEATDIRYTIETGDTDEYRHRYGLEGVGGRNANLLLANRKGILRTLGNLTLIHSMEGILAYEVSFDSTTATSLAFNMGHPVQAHTTNELGTADADIAAVDMLSVSAALLAEGMAPVSKGRAGVLRKFMLEYVRLSRDEIGLTASDSSDILNSAVNEEAVLRAHLTPLRSGVEIARVSEKSVDEWVHTAYLRS